MSLLVDVLIVLVLVGCLVHGYRRGLLGSAGSIIGLVAGLIAAAFIAPPVGALVQDPTGRIALTIGVALILVLVGSALGRRLGSAVGRPLRRTPLGPVDRVLGAGAQVVVGALVVSALASVAVSLAAPEVARPVAGSVLVHQIDVLTPAPVGRAVDGIRSTIVAAGEQAFAASDAPRAVR